MKIGALFIFTLLTIAARCQTTINSYKYVLVPQKFDFFKQIDQYGLNNATKSLLEQKGFTVFWSNGNLPQTLAANKCAALMAEVTERTTFFTTNLTLVLKNCSGDIVFKSKEGKSREKEFDVAYNAALKDAFSSLDKVPYKFDSTLSAQTQQPAAAPPATASPATTAPVTTAPTTASSTTAPPASTQPTASAPPAVAATDFSGTLYAQVIPNGFQLIDTSPKKVLTLLKTSVVDCFLAETGTGSNNGIVFKKNGEWFYEYYKEATLVSKKLEIKF